MPSLCGRVAGSTTVEEVEIGRDCGVKEALDGCKRQKQLTRIPPPGNILGLFNPQIFDTCVCNEMIALRGRVLADVPQPTALGIHILRVQLERMARIIGKTKVITPEEFISRYKGAKAARYKSALASLKVRDVCRSDSIISSFVKAEKFDPSTKESPPDPRMIQCRSPRFNIACGKYLRHIEHKVYKFKEHGLKVMGKGMTPSERGQDVKAKWMRYQNPVALAIDASRFDQHVSLQMLREEHKFYLRCCNEPEFKQLLSMQERNVGFTKHGIRYKTIGRRMSGDLNTAVGNCALMYCMTRGLLRHANVPRFDLCVDGDDTIIILDQKHEHLLGNLPDLFLMMGHEVRLEKRSTSFEGIQWCQSRMCHIGDKPVSVRNWAKVVSATCSGTMHWDNPKYQRLMCHTVGLGMLAENVGVPILQEYAMKLIQQESHKISSWDDIGPLNGLAYDVKNRYSYQQLKSIMAVEVTPSSRISYGNAWHVTPQHQVEIEEAIRSWKIDFGEPKVRENENIKGWKFECHPEDELP